VNRANALRLAALAVLWGSSFLWIKLGLRGFSPVQIVFVRLALGAGVLVPFALARRLSFPAGWRTWLHLFVAALFGNAIPYVLFGVGEQSVGSNVAGILNATTPLWTVLFALVARTERDLDSRQGAGILLGLGGTLLIFSPWNSASEIASRGGVACLAAAASYGVSYVYMGRFLAGQGIPPVMLSASQLTAATAILAAAVPIDGLQQVHWRADAVVGLLILGALGTGVAYVLNYRLITDAGATAASTVTYLLPVVAVLLGWIVLREPVTLGMAAGMVLVLAGVALAQRRSRRDASRPPMERTEAET
jgi:drug/metabolite transporter (DMT)-like permease